MAEIKTRATAADPAAFIAAVENERRRDDARALDALMQRVTGAEPTMWGPSIVGYGAALYSNTTAQNTDWFIVGFSPRKANLVLYLNSGFDGVAPLLARLGKHTIGKGCLYINRLADIDLDVLEAVVKQSVGEMKAREGAPDGRWSAP